MNEKFATAKETLNRMCREIEVRLVEFEKETGIALTDVKIQWVEVTSIDDTRKRYMPRVTARAEIIASSDVCPIKV